MSVQEDWTRSAAVEIAQHFRFGSHPDAYVTDVQRAVLATTFKEIIERHCPFKRDTAYAPVAALVTGDVDITHLVEFENPDDEFLPLLKCVCGQRFELWKKRLHIERDAARECPTCKRQLFFMNGVRVFQKGQT